MFTKLRNMLANQVHIFPDSYFEHQSDADKQRFLAFNASSRKLIEFLRP